MQPLSDQQISDRLQASEWQRDGDAIVRECRLAGFNEVVALVNRIAEAAQAANHHPDLLLHSYNRLKITLTTHSAGGLTENDFSLARAIDGLLG